MSKPTLSHPNLDELIKQSIKAYNALPIEEKLKQDKLQRISWVYGNLSIDNPKITREMVEEVSKKW